MVVLATQKNIVVPQWIELTCCDFIYSEHIGLQREYAWAMSGREQNSHGAKDITPKTRVFGSLAELAVARWLGVTWRPRLLPSSLELDIDGVCEVRSGTEHNHRLIVRKGDKDYPPYIHLTSDDGGHKWKIHGWLYGFEAMKDKYLEAPGAAADREPAFFVPFAKLYDLKTFSPDEPI